MILTFLHVTPYSMSYLPINSSGNHAERMAKTLLKTIDKTLLSCSQPSHGPVAPRLQSRPSRPRLFLLRKPSSALGLGSTVDAWGLRRCRASYSLFASSSPPEPVAPPPAPLPWDQPSHSATKTVLSSRILAPSTPLEMIILVPGSFPAVRRAPDSTPARAVGRGTTGGRTSGQEVPPGKGRA